MNESKDENLKTKSETAEATKETSVVSAVVKERETSDKEEKPKQEIAVVDETQYPTKFNESPVAHLTTPQQLLEFSTTLVEGKMCPYKTPADAMIALIAGKELGLGLAATLGGIYPIEGRPSLGVHVKKGILLQNNVLFKRIRDYEPYYEFVKMEDSKPIVVKHGYLDEQPEGTKKKHIDTKTEYLFTRYFKTPKGIVKNTAKGVFGVSDATLAGLWDKGTYKKYPKDMLASRAFSKGANEIADDLLQGMYSYSELADLKGSVSYYIDDDGHEQILKEN